MFAEKDPSPKHLKLLKHLAVAARGRRDPLLLPDGVGEKTLAECVAHGWIEKYHDPEIGSAFCVTSDGRMAAGIQ